MQVDTVVCQCADNQSLMLVHGQNLSDVALMQWHVFELPLKLLVAGIDFNRPMDCFNGRFELGLLLELVNWWGRGSGCTQSGDMHSMARMGIGTLQMGRMLKKIPLKLLS